MFDLYVHPDVRAVQRLHGDLYAQGAARFTVRDWLGSQAETLVREHARANPAIAVQLRNGIAGLARLDAPALLAQPLLLATARDAVAREHGFESWEAALLDGNQRPALDFETTLDMLLAGRVEELRTRLEQCPELVAARSAFGHRATLLHHLAANGVEIRRQVVPTNAPRLAVVLLEAGADVSARARVYGDEFDTLTLLRTSAHPAAAGVARNLAHVLRAAGARDI